VSGSNLRVLGVAGSLRRASYNRGLLRAALELKPQEMKIEAFEIGEFPPFNQDLETTPLDIVVKWKAAIRAADGLLICTPEYNYGIPGVLKNAIDWASRPYGDNALERKPVALMGASIGMGGTIRCQLALRQCLVWTESYCLVQPEFLVPNCMDRFDENGDLTDEDTRKHVVTFLTAFAAWARRLR